MDFVCKTRKHNINILAKFKSSVYRSFTYNPYSKSNYKREKHYDSLNRFLMNQESFPLQAAEI